MSDETNDTPAAESQSTPPAVVDGPAPQTRTEARITEGEADLQEQVEEQQANIHKKFGTFPGVFTPTLLTILGVIMYLREGWVIGNAGLLYGWLIMALAFAITGFTGLSMSSITTNIRIGGGGAFSMISQSLGLEVGGSIGIPLYLSQALAVVMYVFGFRDGWLYLFPEHPAIIIDLVVFAALFGIAYVSADLAFRIQYVIMAIIIASLGAIAWSAANGSMVHDVTWVGMFPGSPEDGFTGTSFWTVFAVFFPAATGIMAGANMSGDLENPRKSIPLGTMSAIAVSFVIYMLIGYWLARSATPDELVSNYTIMIDLAGPAVLGGLLGATFSSALASIVGAPRILQALGEHNITPGSRLFAELTDEGEPRNAMLLTGGIVFVGLLLRDLNAVAPLITMFFLITYTMVNMVVLIEQRLGLISFRPMLSVPEFIPFLGAAGCIFAMFIVNPTFGLLAFFSVVGLYVYLTRRHLDAPFGDVRSGLFVAVAEWAAKRVSEQPSSERAWKPNLLIPAQDTFETRGHFRLIYDIVAPKGSVKLVGLTADDRPGMKDRVERLAHGFREEGIFSSSMVLESDGFVSGMKAAVQSLSGTFFRPNILFLPMPHSEQEEADAREVILEAYDNRLGVLLIANHPKAGFGRERTINIWVRDQSPDWRLSMHLSSLNLAILIAYKLKNNWKDAQLNLLTAVRDEDQIEAATEYLEHIVELARIPGDATVSVVNQDFRTFIQEAPRADVDIFGLPSNPDFDFINEMVKETRSACIFVRDSGDESALA